MTRTMQVRRPVKQSAAAVSAAGLHGHAHHTHAAAVIASETVGTFFLVLAIAGAAVAAGLAKPISGAPYGSLTIALAGGAALTILATVLGPVSGGHFNPALTAGLAAAHRLPWSRVPVYVISQFVGAISAALAIWGLYGSKARSITYLGATYPAAGVSAGRVLAVEAIVTLLLVLIVVVVASGDRPHSAVAPFAIGAALAAAIVISGPISGAGVNPARAVGPMLVAGRFTDWWAYLVGPLAGAAVAVQLGSTLLAPRPRADRARAIAKEGLSDATKG